MSFTTPNTTQLQFLETYLRGTGRSLSAAQAEALFGIKNLRARMSELRFHGLRVTSRTNTAGRSAYRVSARDMLGSRARIFG